GLDLVFSPPKDIAIMIFAATASSTEDWRQQRACEHFLDAILGRRGAMEIKPRPRMSSSGDPIDVAHLDQIIMALPERGSPPTAPNAAPPSAAAARPAPARPAPGRRPPAAAPGRRPPLAGEQDRAAAGARPDPIPHRRR